MSFFDAIIISGIFLLLAGVITAVVVYYQKIDIRKALEKKGAKNIRISWQPIDFDKSNHTYAVEYEDMEGNLQSKSCKVHIWSSSIYWED